MNEIKLQLYLELSVCRCARWYLLFIYSFVYAPMYTYNGCVHKPTLLFLLPKIDAQHFFPAFSRLHRKKHFRINNENQIRNNVKCETFTTICFLSFFFTRRNCKTMGYSIQHSTFNKKHLCVDLCQVQTHQLIPESQQYMEKNRQRPEKMSSVILKLR